MNLEDQSAKVDLVREWFFSKFKSGAFATWIASIKQPGESALDCIDRIYAKIESGEIR